MTTLSLDATVVYEKNREALYDSRYRFIVNQGGTRSSKTYSIAQLFGTAMLESSGDIYTIVRKTFPALRATSMKDFFDIIKKWGVYSEDSHNKTEHLYKLGGNELEFFSVDEPQKVRGRKRKHLWINEANELSYEDFRQLNMRTTGKIFLDYNPSDEFHWIYEKIIPRDDAIFIQSTYKDNPFLDESLVKEIERYKKTDKNYWRIYGLGERGMTEAAIYNHWQYIDKLPKGYDELFYGLDFGYNNQTALVAVALKDREHFVREKLYETHLTNSDLIEKLKVIVKNKNRMIFADSAEPQRIEEIKKAGFNVHSAKKDVAKGIDTVRSNPLYITKDSTNLQKEIKSYKWKTKDEKVLDEPIKINDHLVDAMRYAIHTFNSKNVIDEDDIDIL